METPLSTRRITRSLTAQKSAAAGREPPSRAALHDITNDSSIVGLAAGGLVHDADWTPRPSAAGAKTRCTPGSGEALLRGQVKTLLQKLDEEAGGCGAAVIRPVRIHALLGVSRSPAQLLAPTPANTPQLGADREGSLLMPDDGLKKMNKTKIYGGRVSVTTALKLSCGLILNLLVLGKIFVLTATVNPGQLREHATTLFNE